MPYIETSDKVPLYYVDEGPRSPSAIFLAHASPLSSRFWQKNIPVLSRQFRVVAMDTRGRGESGKTEEGLTVAQFARDMRHILATLGLDRVLAIGWSFGSTVVLSYMEQFGDDRLAGYINVDQPPFWRGPDDRLRTLIADLPTRQEGWVRDRLLQFLGPEFKLDDHEMRWMVDECMKSSAISIIKTSEDMYRLDYTNFLPKVPVPTRVFWAKHGSIQPDLAKSMKEAIPNSGLAFFEHSGHLMPWTESEKFNSEVATFAQEVLQ